MNLILIEIASFRTSNSKKKSRNSSVNSTKRHKKTKNSKTRMKFCFSRTKTSDYQKKKTNT